MLAYLLKLLSGIIEIEIHPDHFRFRRKDRELIIPTYLDLSVNGKKFKVFAVGEDFVVPDSILPKMRIYLFNTTDPNLTELDKADCLDAFLRYGFSKVSNRVFIRPRVVVSNVNSLQNILGGFQKSLIKQAVLNAGASECTFIN